MLAPATAVDDASHLQDGTHKVLLPLPILHAIHLLIVFPAVNGLQEVLQWSAGP